MSKNLIKNALIGTLLFLIFVICSSNLSLETPKHIESEKTEFPKTSDSSDIEIITPEDKTYVSPMSGYYPATYSFENDPIPSDWTDGSGAGCTIDISEQIGDHWNVLDLYDGSDSTEARLQQTLSDKTTGTVEFWVQLGTSSKASYFYLYDDGRKVIVLKWAEDGKLYTAKAGGGWSLIKSYSANVWYHIRVDFSNNVEEFDVYENGLLILNDEEYRSSSTDGIDYIRYRTDESDSGYHMYVDAIGYSWDANYNIGDNLNEGLLLSFRTNPYISFDTFEYQLDDGTPIKILGNTIISMPNEGPHTIQVFGKDSLGTIYQSDIRHFTFRVINIITPECKIYFSPMSGYYPGTYGFEEGHFRDLTVLYGNNRTIEIVDEINGHKSVVMLRDSSIQGRCNIEYDTGLFLGHGTTEFWYRIEGSLSSPARTYIFLGNRYEYPWEMVSLFLRNEKWRCKDGYNEIDVPNVPDPELNHWYKIQVDWCRDGSNWQGLADLKWRVTIDGISSGTLTYNNHNNRDIERIEFLTPDINGPEWRVYYDAISFSWDPYYTLGDYASEGLLLNFESGMPLEWMGYSLDGQANVEIYGNTTISMPNEGQHTIQVFGKDSLGNMYQSDIRCFVIWICM